MKLYKAYAKVNIFLKITGTRGSYHEIISRFMVVNSLYDELCFEPKDEEEFKIIGDFSCKTVIFSHSSLVKKFSIDCPAVCFKYISRSSLVNPFNKDFISGLL